MNKKKTVIAGSGLSALLMARMIKKYRNPDAGIVIIEKEDQIGGQYGSVHYGDQGCFDIGMHIIYETCVPEIDALIADILPMDEWIVLENNYKDIAGIFVNGHLQTDTPYIDIRRFPQAGWAKYTAELFRVISESKTQLNSVPANAYDVLVRHFGKMITDEIFVPVLEKLYYTHPSGLAEIATKFTTINRLALFDSAVMDDLMKSDEIRARICYPDQLSMPAYRNNTQRGFYPKKYGMYRVIQRLRELLEAEGVVFMTGHSIKKITSSEKVISEVEVSDNQGNSINLPVQEIFWTAGLPGLANTLSIPFKDLVFDKKKTNDVFINILFDKMPAMDKLYYFYPFDKGFRSFRITNYTNYCPDAAGDRGYPLCVELWAREEDGNEDQALIQLALSELKSFGVIDDSYQVKFAAVERAMASFPLPSVNNIQNMLVISDRIKEAGYKNLVTSGILSNRHIFFIKDVLIDTYWKVARTKEFRFGENVSRVKDLS